MTTRKKTDGAEKAMENLQGIDPGPLQGEDPLNDSDTGFEPEEPGIPIRGDAFPGFGEEEPEPRKKGRDKSEWGTRLPAITANLTAGVGLRFRGWLKRHLANFSDKSMTSEAFAAYIENVTLRDALADDERSEEEKQYDWREVHMEGVRDLIMAEAAEEVRAQQEEAAAEQRKAILSRIEHQAKAGRLSDEALKIVRAAMEAVGGDSDV